jgi:hypothetical protein
MVIDVFYTTKNMVIDMFYTTKNMVIVYITGNPFGQTGCLYFYGKERRYV